LWFVSAKLIVTFQKKKVGSLLQETSEISKYTIVMDWPVLLRKLDRTDRVKKLDFYKNFVRM